MNAGFSHNVVVEKSRANDLINCQLDAFVENRYELEHARASACSATTSSEE